MKKIEDSIKFLKSKPKPLAIYAFTRNEKLKQRIIDETSSGSVTFNDAIVQVRNTNHSLPPVTDTDLHLLLLLLNSMHDVSPAKFCLQYGLDSIPFGGVGFGQYHGKYSFEMFSHKKAVLKRSFLIEFMFRYPPWDEIKMGMLRRVYQFDYVSLFLAIVGLRR